MSELEKLMENLIQNTQEVSNIQYNKRNLDITNHLSHLPTSKTLVRKANPRECNLFVTSSDKNQTSFHAKLIKEINAVKQSKSTSSVEHLLALASSLTKFSNVPSLQEKISLMKQQYEEYQLNIDYLESTYNDNEKALNAYSQQTPLIDYNNSNSLEETEQKIVEEEEKIMASENILQQKRTKIEQLKSMINEKRQQLDGLRQQQQERQPDSSVSIHHQQLERIERLRLEITSKKSALATKKQPKIISKKSISSQDSTLDIFDYIQTKINMATHIDGSKHSNVGISNNDRLISILELIIQALQNIISQHDQTNYLVDQLEKLNVLRQQLLTKAIEEKNESIKDAFMANIIMVLNEKGRIPLDDLKNALVPFEQELSLDTSYGSQSIYSLMGKGLITIDRSNDNSYVQLNWK
ncbi:unnamed protein product [Cunninghamella echinulata]